MSNSGRTLADLARRSEALGRSRARGRRGEDAGMVEVRGFGANPGALRMLTYLPESLAPNAPLVVVMHGCTQRAGAFARSGGWLALADRFGFAVLAPEQTPANNPNLCFNWFEPGDVARGAGEPASIHAMIQHMVQAQGLDAGRVFVTGLSAGGAMTAVLLSTYPEVFAAGAVVAGLPYGAARGMQAAFGAMRGGSQLDGEALADLVRQAASPASGRPPPRLAIWHGNADATVDSTNADALARQWAALHGLPEGPSEVGARGPTIRSVWRDFQGDVVIEVNLVSGLGHGVPLAAGGDDPIGEVAPYMLEASVSSSLEIARFWGVALAEADAAPWMAPADLPRSGSASAANLGSVGARVMDAVSRHVSDDVNAVIGAALKRAGLMR